MDIVSSEITRLLNFYVYSYRRKYPNHSLTRDDLLSEARLAALIAVRTYSKKKQAKLTTYIVACVKNHFLNLSRKERANRLIYCDPMELPEVAVLDPSYQYDAQEMLQKILNKDEMGVFYDYIVEGKTLKEISEAKRIDVWKVHRSFTRIVQNYKSIVKSLRA
ncbi:sigma-70 family RNA polymerase sigma factor [bacterium]|nr:sigma-70 family RNA polymerase sigma factor [bacterium]